MPGLGWEEGKSMVLAKNKKGPRCCGESRSIAERRVFVRVTGEGQPLQGWEVFRKGWPVR